MLVKFFQVILLCCVALPGFAQPKYGLDKREIAGTAEVLELDRQLSALQDSIATIQVQLINIIEDSTKRLKTKDQAVHTLAKIHEESVVEYLVKNEGSLRFGSPGPDSDDFEMEYGFRSAMSALSEEYIHEYEINWIVFPYLLKYLDHAGFLEFGFIRQLYGYGYGDIGKKDPWYLLKFMQSNARPGFREIVELELEDLAQRGEAKN